MQTGIMDDGRWRRRRRASQAALVFLLLFSLTIWAPVASQAQSPVPEEAAVPTDIEAWYYVADEGAEPPVPPPVLPDPVNPYGENTLHVSVTGGQEETRTYLTLDTASLPVTFELIEGILELSIDPGGVTLNPDTARVQVCLSDPPPESVEGSFEEPPEVDCASKVPATYEAEPSPHLVADITDFGTDLTFSGLAIMPSVRAREQGDTWHLTFYGKKNESEGAKPITARLTFIEPVDPIFDLDDGSDDTETGSVPDFSSGDSGGFDFDTSTAPSFDVGSAPGDEVVDEPGDAASPMPAAEEDVFALASEEAPPSYTIVWALPLLLLAFASYFSSALTRQIVVRRDRPSA